MPLNIFDNTETLSRNLADWMVSRIGETLQRQDRFTLVLSGGSTPKKLHEILAGDDYRDRISWDRLHIFWGDERFVPFSDERNNARMGFETLLRHVPVPEAQVHIMPTENTTPEDAARRYERILHEYFPSPGPGTETSTFDLVLLGMGDDGHTLSLFPGKTAVIHETSKWCTSLWLESQDMYRVTLTHPVVNRAAAVAFLVTGSAKAKALGEVLKGPYDPDLYPSQIIRPLHGELHWFTDKAAAALVR